jgi:lia operon protein LiaG
MKKMKHLLTFTLLALFFASPVLRAQEHKIPVENTKEGRLTLDDFTGDLPIEGYSGNEIIITGTSEHFETPERAKGLKSVFAAGTDNTGLGVFFEKDGNKVTLRCLLPITQSANYKIRVPENLALKIVRDCAKGGHTTIENMKNEIEFKGCHSITLKNVTGPLVVSTISGNVSVVFSEISKDKPISLASVSGEVDVTLSAKAAVDLEMSTISGGMYTDFDLTQDSKEMRRIGGGTIRSKVNGGGTDLKLRSISGNIYLRKG